MITILPVSWALLVLVGAWRYRPESSRVAARLETSRREPADPLFVAAVGSRRQVEGAVADSLSRVGQVVIDRLPQLGVLPQLWVGLAVVVLAGLLPWAPVASVVLAGSTLVAGVWTARRQRWRSVRGQAQQMVALMRMLSLTVGAGATLRTALIAAADRVDPPLGPALVRARHRLESGATVAETLDRFSAELSVEHRVVIERLLAAEMTGAPLGSLLRSSAQSLAERRRHDSEVRARRLPVLMLMPLVCCVLPAFVVLAIVPMVVSGGSSLFPL